ncbi:MAG TPA: GNAT family N-acetyltransferase [Gaiellaceae bacterium]|nr:GNAT family N-acetyltransferase [Gaiellaceae bacterium]
MSVERIVEFRRRLQRDAAESVVPFEHGTAFLSPSIPQVYDHNYLSIEEAETGAGELAAESAEALAGHFHRRVIVESATPGLQADFAALGYVLSTHLVLEHRREPDRLVDTAAIRETGLEALVPTRTEATLREQWGDEEIAAQLNEAKRHIAAAVPTRFFAAFVGDQVAGWCELRVRDGVAQIEDVEVLVEYRGFGLGRALVQHALTEGQRVADVVFLEALADDWPRELYAKLGFVGAGRRDFYTRLPHPFTRIRLRTPRLELRAATVAEARRLFEVAKADNLDAMGSIPDVTDVSESHVRFVAFLDGQPIGVQALDVSSDRVATRSWLGRTHRALRLETEMRAAVLTYAFERLGATVARSSAIDGSEQSPDVELRRERFVSPVPVEVVGAR